jgi:endoglucanase
MNGHRQTLLTSLLAQPTAPFCEQHVIRTVRHALTDARVPSFPDPVGNLIVGCASCAEYLKLVRTPSREPLRVFIAHMDHPGFHGVRWRSPVRLAIQWHGGSPVKHLRGARVWLATDEGNIAEGRLAKVRLTKSGQTIDTAEVRLQQPLAQPRPPATAIYGGFQFSASVWRQGQLIYTQAADDLVGVFAILNTAIDLFSERRHRSLPPFIGLLTRGEEVGFVGAVGHFELGWLRQARRPVVCISLETSRTLPGALIGQGPVVRLGDRRTVFDPDGLKLLSDLAQQFLPRAHQRRIMDGGSCEATAATAYGFPAIGLSVPLGNYHNQGLEGGPECRGKNGPAPEFVHMGDIQGMLKLCRALLRPRLPWGQAWQEQRRRLQRNLRHYKRFL